MDFFVKTYTTTEKEPIQDFAITNKGELKTIFGENEIEQRAILSAFLQKGSIPQLPETGVEWAEFVTGDITPAEINSQVLKSIHECANTYSYLPYYSYIDDKLLVSIKRGI